MEEQQRILGVFPNFFVTYDHDPVPLHARQKYELAFRTMIDPETIGMDLVSSGVPARDRRIERVRYRFAGICKTLCRRLWNRVHRHHARKRRTSIAL